MQVLGRRPDAPLSEIASAAEVGRTTLHRYYPDRASLVDAISGEAAVRISAALQRAGLTEGDAREALLRASRELFDLGPVLSLVFGPLLSDRPECGAIQVTASTVSWARSPTALWTPAPARMAPPPVSLDAVPGGRCWR
jgi:AcrR family transcriptional regulator